MFFVYEVIYDHQIEPLNYGLYSSLDKALRFLRDKGVDTDMSNCRKYYESIYCFGNYTITRKSVM